MTSTVVSPRLIAALSVAVMLFAAPIASAQSREDAPPIAAPGNRALLSPAAFTRLVQPSRTERGQVTVAKEPPRFDLSRQAVAVMFRQAQTAAKKPPQPRSWVARHKTITIIMIGAGAFFAAALWSLSIDD